MSRLTERNKHVCNLCGQRSRCIRGDCQLVRLYDKLKHYEDLEEAGRLIVLDFDELKRDELDRCTNRHCNKCDKYRLELQLYKDNDGRVKEMIGMDMAEASMRFASYMAMKKEGRLIEVVRCKDCIRHENSSIEEGYGWCDEHERITGDDDYCSYAISKFEVKSKLAELKEGE